MFFFKSDPKKIKIRVFLLALLTLIFGASPKVILPIGQTLLKSDPCPVYLKKMFCLPTNPILFLKNVSENAGIDILTCIDTIMYLVIFLQSTFFAVKIPIFDSLMITD